MKQGEDAPSCYQESGKDFITQMGKPFSKYPGKSDPSSNTTLISYTKNIMDKQPIPSVKMDIEKIRKVADTSPQYESIYSLNDISTIQARHNIFEDDEGKKIQISEEARQINRSAKLAALACYNKEPEFEDDNGNKKVPFACKDRFRREDKNFPRPKKCIDYYWEKNTKYPKFASGNQVIRVIIGKTYQLGIVKIISIYLTQNIIHIQIKIMILMVMFGGMLIYLKINLKI